jgi:hypothetical protein
MEPKETKRKKISGLIMSDMLSYERKGTKPNLLPQTALPVFLPVKTEIKAKAKASIEDIWNDADIEPPKIQKTPRAQKTKNLRKRDEPGADASIEEQASINFIRKHHKLNAKIFALRKTNFAAQLISFASVAIFIVIVFQGVNIFAQSQNTKSIVLGSATEAISHLQAAAALTSQQNIAASQVEVQQAEQNFAQAKDSIAKLGPLLDSAFSLSGKGKTANMILDAGESVALAGENLNNFYSQVSALKVTAQGFDTAGGFYEGMVSARAYLQKGNNYLDHANQDLAQADPSKLPANFSAQFNYYRSQLSQAIAALSQADDLLGLLQNFVGKGQKSILVLFENNREMRASGGFIGTYGFFKLSDGKVISQKISSIYDLDGQLKQKIAPPGPFHDLTDHWGIRDSNWFADFKTSAQKASLFYEKEGLETPDAVVAITPDLFVDLLKLTGAIDFPKYNVVLSADNFRDEVQLNTSVLYDKQDNTPKQMLADFAPLLLQRMVQLPPQNYPALFSAILSNLAQKNILFYDRNPDVQAQFESYNWAGRIAETDKDYLAVINTNLGGRKTDLDVSQALNLSSEVQDDGSIINTITYSRKHSPSLLEPDSKNIDYVRFLVPKGSTIISASGFTKHNFYHSDGSDYPQTNQPFTVDTDLENMDANSKIDVLSGTVITEESNKTEFANWIETSPGQSSTITLQYKLPFNINSEQKYSFVLQKQPGNVPVDFSYSFNPAGRKVLWYTPFDLAQADGIINYKQTLKSDIFIGVVLGR